jgi:hypothetical protein
MAAEWSKRITMLSVGTLSSVGMELESQSVVLTGSLAVNVTGVVVVLTQPNIAQQNRCLLWVDAELTVNRIAQGYGWNCWLSLSEQWYKFMHWSACVTGSISLGQPSWSCLWNKGERHCRCQLRPCLCRQSSEWEWYSYYRLFRNRFARY